MIFRDDETELLLAELAKVKKERELAKKREVMDGMCVKSVGRGEGTNGSRFESRGNDSFKSIVI